MINEVNCDSSKKALLNCSYVRLPSGEYGHCGSAAGVSCSGEQLRVKNVNAAIVDTPCTTYAVLISWELHSGAPHNPSSFSVQCFNQQHRIELFVNDGNLTQITVRGLLSSTSYNCCVSAIYYYETGRRCTSSEIFLSDSFTTPTSGPTEMLKSNSFIIMMIPAAEKVVSSDLNIRISVIGGVLGAIIIILLLLLAMCGGALLYMLRVKSVISNR